MNDSDGSAATLVHQAGVAEPTPADRPGRFPRFRRRAQELFFPEAIALSGRQLWLVSAISGLFMLACYPLLLGWRSFPGPRDIIWAEDGPNFLHDALAGSWISTVLNPYAGYMHLVPRTIASLVVQQPVGRWPLAIAVISIAIRAAIAVFAWHATSGHIPSKLARAAISIVVVTIPLGGAEVLNNLANLHWYLLFACLPAVLWRPRGWFGIVVQCVVVVSGVLSDPLALLLTPVVVLRIIALSRWRDRIVCGTFLGAAAIQFAVVMGTTRVRGPGMTVGEIYQAYVIRTVDPAFAGISVADWAWSNGRAFGLVLSTVVVLAILVGGLLRPGPHRGLILTSAGFSVVLYAFIAGLSMSAALLLPEPSLSVVMGGRYGFVAGLFLLTATIAACWAMVHFSRRSRPAFIALVTVLSLLYLSGVVDAYGYRSKDASVQGWREAVASAAQECQSSTADQVSLPIDPAGWLMDVPCAVLER